MPKSTASTTITRHIHRGLFIGILLCLILLPSSRCQPTGDCPYDGLLVLRPVDPFLFVGESTTLCCMTVEPKTLERLPHQHTADVVFTCNGGSTAADPLPISSENNGTVPENWTACATVTVTDENQQGFCSCKVNDRPKCQASQYLTVDNPLPSTLNFSCITYGSSNVTCRLEVPAFKHMERIGSSIKWAQIDPTGRRRQSFRSKVCGRHDLCELFSRDGIVFGLPMVFNISVQLTYDRRHGKDHPDAQVSTVSSKWIAYDIMGNTLLAPLQASVLGINSSSVTITWPRQFTTNSDKIIHIYYMCDQDGQKSFNTLEVREKLLFTMEPVVVVLRDLRPSTTYMIAMRTKTVDSASDLWSQPTYLTATTHP